MTIQKLSLIKHLSHSPNVVKIIPKQTPVLSPYLSSANTDGKFNGANMIIYELAK